MKKTIINLAWCCYIALCIYGAYTIAENVNRMSSELDGEVVLNEERRYGASFLLEDIKNDVAILSKGDRPKTVYSVVEGEVITFDEKSHVDGSVKIKKIDENGVTLEGKVETKNDFQSWFLIFALGGLMSIIPLVIFGFLKKGYQDFKKVEK